MRFMKIKAVPRDGFEKVSEMLAALFGDSAVEGLGFTPS